MIKWPYLDEFLIEMSLWFNLFIFTKSEKYYSENILEIIDKNNVIKGVYNRNNLTFSKGKFFKDLSVIEKD